MSGKSRVLILGGRGLLGYHFMEGLKENYQVLGTARSKKTKRNEIYFDSERDPSTLCKILNAFQPHVIVNTIGFVTVEGCQSDKEKAYRLNAGFVSDLVRIINSAVLEPCHLIQVSSDSVYGSVRKQKCADKAHPLWHEDDAVNPMSVYAASKYQGELEALRHGGPVTILRTAFYGINPFSRKSLLWWIIDNARKKNPMDGWENIYFNPLSAKDFVSVTDKIISNNITGILNIGSDDACNKYDFVEAVCNALSIKTTVNRVTSGVCDLSSIRPHFSVLNVDRLDAALSYRRSWHESLIAYLSNMPPFPD